MSGLTGGHELRAQVFAPVAAEVVIGLAVSGGPDSLAMMVSAAQWVAETPLAPRLVVYTLDHGLRAAATEEAAMVAREAKRLGLACRILRWDGPHPDTGIQAAARAARYRLIGGAMRADGARILVTAHHAEDQAETVLMRLAHGSGLAGLAGMAAFSEIEGVTVFRPFLRTPGAVLRAALAGTGIDPAQDPSNADPGYERVRWRGAMTGLAGLGLDTATLTQFARRMGEADAALSALAADAIAEGVSVDPTGALAMPWEWFCGLAPAIATRVLQQVLDRAGGGRGEYGLEAVERLRDRIAGPGFDGQSLHFCLVKVRNGTIHVMREPGRLMPEVVEIEAAGRLLWDGRFRIANRRNAGAVVVAMATGWSRERAEAFVGQAIGAPIHAIRSAPVVASAGGEVLAFGLVSRDSAIAIEPQDVRTAK